jgi:sec-independent protein translocase protein TatB
MFDFSWSELLVIGIVALVFIGPKELPGVLRTLGQWMSKVRRMAGEFQNQFHDAMREAELHDLKKEVDAMASSYTQFDPLADVRKDMEATQREIETAVAGTAAEHVTPSTSPEPAPAATEPAAEPTHSPTPQVEAPAAAAEAPAEQRVEPAVQHGAAGSEPA